MLDATPIMEDDDRRQAERLSLDSLRPPLRVPGYEQERFLGRGSFGEVWTAIDSNSGRTVAIKYYNRRGEVDWALLAREVEKLRHLFTDRHVVQLFSVGWNADPPYYVMEYMENGSLEDRLRSGTIPPEETVEIVREVCRGLVHAHGKGILHCDLKPGNILLDQDGRPRLADFGQSRLSHEQSPSLGTLYYMAPEQADLKGIPDARWDVYALGAMMYCMLTGNPPHRKEGGEESAVLQANSLAGRLERYRTLLQTSPRPTAHRQVPGIDSGLIDIIDRCLAVNPHDRYPNAQAVLTALDVRATRQARRPLLVLGAVAPALVVLIMAFLGWWLFGIAIRTAQDQAIELAENNNRFAARAVAERFALDIDKRWRILEQEADDPQLEARLRTIGDLGQRLLENNRARTQGRNLIHDPEWKEQQAWFGEWIRQKRFLHDASFPPTTQAMSWFILDRSGINLGRSPPDPAVTGERWEHRDYFHGEGRDYERDPNGRRKPCAHPHRSIVFRSLSTNKLSVAFTVPIWGKQPAGSEPLGVLIMTSELSRFAEWEGSPDQYAVLIDTRGAGESGKRGMVIEHPVLLEQQQAQRSTAWTEYYVGPEILTWADELSTEKRRHLIRRMQQEESPEPFGSEFIREPSEVRQQYRDPLQPDVGTWLVALEPVIIPHSREEILDSDWTVLVEQDLQKVLAPVQVLRGKLIVGMVIAVLVVLLVVAALWGFVVLVLDHTTSSPWVRAIRHRLGLSSTSMSGGSSGSASLHRTDSLQHTRQPPTVISTEQPKEDRR